jgi:threonine dehydrogenase-like Zn-dependent dehydrogenase
MATMSGVVLPGDSTVKHVEVDVPEPGHGQVLLQMKASSICGSDIHAIYREHLGSRPEDCRVVIAGHEPCGQVVAVRPGCRRISAAHGWQRDGGHAEFLLSEEATCILLPDELSYVGGALTPHLHPLAHGATAVTRSLTRRPA